MLLGACGPSKETSGDSTDIVAQDDCYDEDGDGHGDPSGIGMDSGVTGLQTDICDDCNDGDPRAYPGAAEVCDGADNDCDGQTDEPDASDAATWYPDADHDGSGADSGAVAQCDPPAGYVASGGDCDDSNREVNPASTEYCDGYDDILLGAPEANVWWGRQGVVYLFRGPLSGTLRIDVDADATLLTDDAADYGCATAGYAAWAGDVDADGATDILIGGPLQQLSLDTPYEHYGSTWLVRGGLGL